MFSVDGEDCDCDCDDCDCDCDDCECEEVKVEEEEELLEDPTLAGALIPWSASRWYERPRVPEA